MYRYAIFTPARNEEAYIAKTLKSVVNQTIPPTVWLILDDGSTDKTRHIIEQFALNHSYIQLLTSDDRGFRNYTNVQVKLKRLSEKIDINSNEFVVKLDADLCFDQFYFKKLFEEFKKDSNLGIAGGLCYVPIRGKLIPEKTPSFHVRGPTKVYRTECFIDIGGISESVAYDTIDEIKANLLGWRTRTFNNIKIVHLRKTGASAGTAIKWRISQGRGSYYSAYHPIFFLLRSLRHIFSYPYILGTIAMLYGYFVDYIQRKPQIDDPKFIQFIRREQINKLLFKKTIWK